MNDKQKKAIARKSLNYTAGLKKAIHSGDLEGVIKSVMLLAVKHIKYRETFGSDEGFGEILELLEGGQD